MDIILAIRFLKEFTSDLERECRLDVQFGDRKSSRMFIKNNALLLCDLADVFTTVVVVISAVVDAFSPGRVVMSPCGRLPRRRGGVSHIERLIAHTPYDATTSYNHMNG
jgi:hypothetical protein